MSKIAKIMKPYKFITNTITTLLFTIISINSVAQFNVRPSSSSVINSGVDTIKLTQIATPTPLDLSIYSNAYDRYLKNEIFKYRNKIKLQTSIGINQTSFDNWAAGGTNSFSGRLWVNFTHTYTNEEKKFNVISNFEGAYTMVITNEKTTKSEDFWNINVTPSWKLAPRWEISGSFVLKSQFTDANNNDGDLTSTIFAPATLNVSAGITYVSNNKNFSAYLAPLSGNGTFVLNKELSD